MFFLAAGGDFTFNFGSFHFKEIASKTWYHTVSSHSLKELDVVYGGMEISRIAFNASIHFGDAVILQRRDGGEPKWAVTLESASYFYRCKMTLILGRRPWMCWKNNDLPSTGVFLTVSVLICASCPALYAWCSVVSTSLQATIHAHENCGKKLFVVP